MLNTILLVLIFIIVVILLIVDLMTLKTHYVNKEPKQIQQVPEQVKELIDDTVNEDTAEEVPETIDNAVQMFGLSQKLQQKWFNLEINDDSEDQNNGK